MDYLISNSIVYSLSAEAIGDILPFGAQVIAKPIKTSCDLNDMLEYIFSQIEFNMSETKEKELLLGLVYNSINNYFSQFTGKTDKLLSKYKRDSIIGFIVYKFGFQLSKEIREFNQEEPSNELLHQAIKYRTTTLQKKKSK